MSADAPEQERIRAFSTMRARSRPDDGAEVAIRCRRCAISSRCWWVASRSDAADEVGRRVWDGLAPVGAAVVDASPTTGSRLVVRLSVLL